MLSSEDDQLDLAAKAPNKQERWQKEPRPNKFHEVGLKGRKTGIMAPTAVERDADGLMNVGDWFRDADEEITELARGISEEFPTTPVKDAPLQPNDTELSQKTSPSTPLPPSPSPAMKQRVSVRRVANNAISRLPRPSMFDLQLDSPLLSTPVTFNVTTNPFMSDKELLPSVSPTKKRSRRDTPADLELPASETIPTEDLDQIAFGRIPTEDLNQLPLEAIATEDIHLASETIQTEDLDLLVSETIQTKTSFSISGHGLDDDEKEITVNKKIPAKRASERSNGLESEPELRPEFESESDQQQELDDPIQNSEPSSEADEVLSIKPIKKPMKKPTKKGSVSRRENRASEDSLEPEPELHPEPESVPDQQHEPDDSSQDSESPSEMAEKRQRKLIKKQPLKKPTNKGSISRRARFRGPPGT
ncbi:hypothetical protein DFS34DRAFT_137213 [Phlyctochytrium arcticum]|nr:hypothetical protein DFS34DRAFT_137213 [Phlyctochytrium arcticum]